MYPYWFPFNGQKVFDTELGKKFFPIRRTSFQSYVTVQVRFVNKSPRNTLTEKRNIHLINIYLPIQGNYKYQKQSTTETQQTVGRQE